MDLKETWDQYKELIKVIVGAVSVICTAIVFVGGLVISSMITEQIKDDTGQVKAVTDLNTSVGKLTVSLEGASVSIIRLDKTVSELNSDVKFLYRELGGNDDD